MRRVRANSWRPAASTSSRPHPRNGARRWCARSATGSDAGRRRALRRFRARATTRRDRARGLGTTCAEARGGPAARRALARGSRRTLRLQPREPRARQRAGWRRSSDIKAGELMGAARDGAHRAQGGAGIVRGDVACSGGSARGRTAAGRRGALGGGVAARARCSVEGRPQGRAVRGARRLPGCVGPLLDCARRHRCPVV